MMLQDWKSKVRRSGLAEYDIIILEQLGVKGDLQIARFENSIKGEVLMKNTG